MIDQVEQSTIPKSRFFSHHKKRIADDSDVNGASYLFAKTWKVHCVSMLGKTNIYSRRTCSTLIQMQDDLWSAWEFVIIFIMVDAKASISWATAVIWASAFVHLQIDATCWASSSFTNILLPNAPCRAHCLTAHLVAFAKGCSTYVMMATSWLVVGPTPFMGHCRLLSQQLFLHRIVGHRCLLGQEYLLS